jgi:hypothetical protein
MGMTIGHVEGQDGAKVRSAIDLTFHIQATAHEVTKALGDRQP